MCLWILTVIINTIQFLKWIFYYYSIVAFTIVVQLNKSLWPNNTHLNPCLIGIYIELNREKWFYYNYKIDLVNSIWVHYLFKMEHQLLFVLVLALISINYKIDIYQHRRKLLRRNNIKVVSCNQIRTLIDMKYLKKWLSAFAFVLNKNLLESFYGWQLYLILG